MVISKYAAKKARQAETGEVGYLTAEVKAEVKVAMKKGQTLQTDAERRAQSERDKERNAAKNAQENKAAALHVRGFVGRMEDAVLALDDAETSITLAKAHANGAVKGDVLAVMGIYGVASQKAQSALLRARMLLAALDGAKS